MIALLLAMPALAVTYTVTNAADAGAGSLRAALTAAGAGDQVVFGTAAFPAGSRTRITLVTALPPIAVNLVLDGDDRAGIQCPATLVANGLTVVGNFATVVGLEVRNCSENGISVSGINVRIGSANAALGGNVITGNKKAGILVVGSAATTAGVIVENNTLTSNCSSSTTSCGSVVVQNAAAGAGPSGVQILGNRVDGTGSGGAGIGLVSGVNHQVRDNDLGLLAANTGHGIVLAAAAGQTVSGTVRDNVVVNSTKDGILLGTRSNGSLVEGNLVGTDGVLDRGNGLAGIEIFASDDQIVRDNVVSGNTTSGIVVNGVLSNSPAERAEIYGNVVGLGADGLLALGNSGAGIRLEGNNTPNVGGHNVYDNVVSANGGDGIRVSAFAYLWGNFIGLAEDGFTARGNTGDGVRATTQMFAKENIPEEWLPNVVSSNGGSGFVLASGTSLVLSHNLIGVDAGRTVGRGNALDGVRIEGGTGHLVEGNEIGWSGLDGVAIRPATGQTVVDVDLEDNELHDNTGVGIRVTKSTTDRIQWSGNEVRDNGLCAIRIENNANGVVAAPVVTVVTPVSVSGTYVVPGGQALLSVQVFSDAGSEAGRFLGIATAAAGTFSLALDDDAAPIPSTARVSAVLLLQSGRTSGLAAWCNDGCTGTVANTCGDGDPCTTDTCQAGGCVYGNAANGLVCDDGNACTTATTCSAGLCGGGGFAAAGTDCVDLNACSNNSVCNAAGTCEPRGNPVQCSDGLGCTEEFACDPTLGCLEPQNRPVGFACADADEDCKVGETCDAFQNCTGGTSKTCPEDTACNECVCNEGAGGCECEGICGDAFCGPDDLVLGCAECYRLGVLDGDFDGFPDVWEVGGADLNCDGTIDIPSSTFTSGKDLFWEIDYMDGGPSHSHEPYPGGITDLVVTFQHPDAAITLNVEVNDLLPHQDVVRFARGTPRFGSAPDWVAFDTIKRDHFDLAHRRGVYHYAVSGHRVDEPNETSSGWAERPGDDFVVTFLTRPDVVQQMGTFLHEGSHNLGLTHGGDDGNNFEANYGSVMSYRFQFSGLLDAATGDHVPDLSHFDFQTLDEGGFTEVGAFAPGGAFVGALDPLYSLRWSCPPAQCPPFLPNCAMESFPHNPVDYLQADVDLGCNGVRGDQVGLSFDLATQGDATQTIHTSYDDWGNVDLSFQLAPTFARGASPEDPEPEFSPEAAVALRVWYPPAHPRTELLPGCTEPTIPLSGSTRRVPVILYGSATETVDDLSLVGLSNAAPITSDNTWDFDADGFDDLWLEFRVQDLTALSTAATEVGLYGVRPDSQEVFATFDIARVSNPTDTDGDGIHNTCDDCPTTPTTPGAWRDPWGCPCPTTPATPGGCP